MPRQRSLGTKAERTHERILAAAEEIFAEDGFAEARLEDVAERVGIQRTGLFYYYRDKDALYRAVLERVFGGLLSRIQQAIAAPQPLPRRLEAAVNAWVDYVAERPSTARILLREAASATSHRRATVSRIARPFVELTRRVFEEGKRQGSLKPVVSDPFHVMSSVVGSTVFFVAAMPALVPDLSFDPLESGHIEEHRQDVLRIARRLLGIRAPRSLKEA